MEQPDAAAHAGGELPPAAAAAGAHAEPAEEAHATPSEVHPSAAGLGGEGRPRPHGEPEQAGGDRAMDHPDDGSGQEDEGAESEEEVEGEEGVEEEEEAGEDEGEEEEEEEGDIEAWAVAHAEAALWLDIMLAEQQQGGRAPAPEAGRGDVAADAPDRGAAPAAGPDEEDGRWMLEDDDEEAEGEEEAAEAGPGSQQRRRALDEAERDSDDGGGGEAVEEFSDDDNSGEAQDTTAEQLWKGRDIQGGWGHAAHWDICLPDCACITSTLRCALQASRGTACSSAGTITAQCGSARTATTPTYCPRRPLSTGMTSWPRRGQGLRPAAAASLTSCATAGVCNPPSSTSRWGEREGAG